MYLYEGVGVPVSMETGVQVPTEARGIRSPRAGVMVKSPGIWVLGTELGSSRGVASHPKC